MFDSFQNFAIVVIIFLIVVGTFVGFAAAIMLNAYAAFLCLGIILIDVFLYRLLDLISK